MGWWTVERLGKELVQGDEPYDIMMEAFQQIAQEYRQDWNRKPTLAEIIQTVETVLATGVDTYSSDGTEIEVIRLSVKTRKRRKNQPFKVGDFFVIPLRGGLYAFGRILSDLRLGEMGMLVGIYDEVSKQILSPTQLKREKFMFAPFYCDDEGWKKWKWKIIGYIAIEPDEFEYPKHKEGLEGMGWWIRDKNQVYESSAEDVRDLEYAKLWSSSAIEKRIMKYLENKEG